MYDYIKGTLTKITAKHLVVEAYGIGYLLHIANPYRFSDRVGQDVQLYLYQVVREDAQLLYAFASESEKEVFLNLISVTGIGPTTALAIIAVDDNDGLVAAIDSSNITYLTKFPKVGKKTAQQMVLDLAGKFEPRATSADANSRAALPLTPENTALEEAIEALLALGYKAAELKKIKTFFDGTTDTTENYIKSALKMLMK
ncbi:Holliday junction branch migration protein RuvA [Streptococcus sp. E17BB]|uniref:Holliday junction branch migration protein RuvA n=1 Tax=Streptococcus sp. E17BB TaxID=3278714 RepID=UPI00359DAF65